MNTQINQRFVNEANKVMEENPDLTKSKFAKSIGYTIHSLRNVMSDDVKTVVQYDNLLEFCDKYGYDKEFFLDHDNYVKNEEMNQEVQEIVAVYSTNETVEKEVIKKQFNKMETTQEFMISMLENGVNLLKQMQLDTRILKEMTTSKGH